MSAIEQYKGLVDVESEGIRFLDAEEAREIVDRHARKYFDMSAEEFVHAWRDGELDDHPNQSEVTFVAMMLPLISDE